jgi:hypothetical protein
MYATRINSHPSVSTFNAISCGEQKPSVFASVFFPPEGSFAWVENEPAASISAFVGNACHPD